MSPPRPSHAPPGALAACALRAGLVLCVLAVPGRSLGLEGSGSAHVELGAAVDSNAGRELDPQAQGDALLLGQLGLEGAVGGVGPLELAGRYALGAKRFVTLHGNDLLAQELAAELRSALPPLTLALAGRLKDRHTRSQERDYTSLGAGLSGARRLGRLGLRLELGAERFVFRSDPAYSYGAPRAALEASWALAPRHRLTAEAELSRHRFDDPSAPQGTDVRVDQVLAAGLTYRFKGPLLASAGYGFLQSASNQPGRSLQRHRLDASVGVFLPAEIALAATAAVQRTRFLDGLILSPELLLTVDDENTNSATLSLSRRFESGLQVELRGAAYLADFSGSDLRYRRGVAQLTLGWDGPP